jgi:hypothetical protein
MYIYAVTVGVVYTRTLSECYIDKNYFFIHKEVLYNCSISYHQFARKCLQSVTL